MSFQLICISQPATFCPAQESLITHMEIVQREILSLTKVDDFALIVCRAFEYVQLTFWDF